MWKLLACKVIGFITWQKLKIFKSPILESWEFLPCCIVYTIQMILVAIYTVYYESVNQLFSSLGHNMPCDCELFMAQMMH
jgi:hypothetical protein